MRRSQLFPKKYREGKCYLLLSSIYQTSKLWFTLQRTELKLLHSMQLQDFLMKGNKFMETGSVVKKWINDNTLLQTRLNRFAILDHAGVDPITSTKKSATTTVIPGSSLQRILESIFSISIKYILCKNLMNMILIAVYNFCEEDGQKIFKQCYFLYCRCFSKEYIFFLNDQQTNFLKVGILLGKVISCLPIWGSSGSLPTN